MGLLVLVTPLLGTETLLGKKSVSIPAQMARLMVRGRQRENKKKKEKNRVSISCVTKLEFNKRNIKRSRICLDTARFFNISHHARFPWK